MIAAYSIHDIKFVSIRNKCSGVMPCQHQVNVILNDGTEAEKILGGLQIWELISNLNDEQILTRMPSYITRGKFCNTKPEHPEEYKKHFSVYDDQTHRNSRFKKILNCFKKDKDLSEHEQSVRKTEEVLRFLLTPKTPKELDDDTAAREAEASESKGKKSLPSYSSASAAHP